MAIRRHPKGGFVVTPPGSMTDADRANLKEVAATLEPLLRAREEAAAQGLSPSQAHAIDQIRAEFDATLIEIKPVEIRPGVPTKPARTKQTRKPDAPADVKSEAEVTRHAARPPNSRGSLPATLRHSRRPFLRIQSVRASVPGAGIPATTGSGFTARVVVPFSIRPRLHRRAATQNPPRTSL